MRRQINGINQQNNGEGSSKVNYDDLQKLIKTQTLSGVKYTDKWTSLPYNADYMNYISMDVMAKNDCCPDRGMIVYIVDKADLSIVLRDSNTKPSFDWGETVATISNNIIDIYTNNDFEVTSAKLTYYRYPVPVQFQNCPDITTGLPTGNVPCEFKDDVAEILVDSAVAILASDIESFNQMRRATDSVQVNT